jgi:hypothetical protein
MTEHVITDANGLPVQEPFEDTLRRIARSRP